MSDKPVAENFKVVHLAEGLEKVAMMLFPRAGRESPFTGVRLPCISAILIRIGPQQGGVFVRLKGQCRGLPILIEDG